MQKRKLSIPLEIRNLPGEYQCVLNLRNLTQVQNHQAISKSCHQLSKDDIYNMIQLAYHLEWLVSEIHVTVLSDMTTVSALPEIVKTFTEILQSIANTSVSLVYDTTFNLGDFLSFEGTPWIPLAFLSAITDCSKF